MPVEVEHDVRGADGDALAEAARDVAASFTLSVITWPQVTTSAAPGSVGGAGGGGVRGLEAQLELRQRDLGRILRLLPRDEGLLAALGVALGLVADDPAVARHRAGEDRRDVRVDVEVAVALTGVRRRGRGSSIGSGWLTQLSVLSFHVS